MSETGLHIDNLSPETLLQKAQVIFWDFDGVIKDSVEVKSEGFERLFMPYGSEVAARVRQHHEAHGGISRYEKMPVYLGWAGESASAEQVQNFCDQFASLVLQAVINAPWVPGIREYLLANYGKQRFILVTATPQQEIEQILNALELAHCFQEVHGAPTSKATAIKSVLQKIQCPAEYAVMVGDTETDLKAAKANHVPFLLRCTPLNQTLKEQYSGLMFDALGSII